MTDAPNAQPPVHDPGSFRTVPKTGVIYVMSRAAQRGFRYGHPDWANLGQGAPETGTLPGAPERLEAITMGHAQHEYAPVGGLRELRQAVADLYNARYRRGMASQYTADNVAISSGGRAGLTRIAAALGNTHLGHLLPDYTAYAELLDNFRAFVPIPIVVDRESGFQLSPARLEREILSRGIGAMLLSNPCNPTGQRLGGESLDEMVTPCSKPRWKSRSSSCPGASLTSTQAGDALTCRRGCRVMCGCHLVPPALSLSEGLSVSRP